MSRVDVGKRNQLQQILRWRGELAGRNDIVGESGASGRWSGEWIVDRKTNGSKISTDRDGKLDLFVANYIDFDIKTVPVPEGGTCLYKGLKVVCGPPGLKGGRNILFHNNGDGTFREIAIESGVAYSADGKSQAGMGVSVADYDGDGLLDIVKTNFAGDTSSLYRNQGKNLFEDLFEDQTFQSGLGRNTRFLGWGADFADFDNDGRPDILLCNGHVYPEVGDTDTEAGYRQCKVIYRNLGGGKFADVSTVSGAGILESVAGRGMAVGDFDNDGDLDVVVNCVNDVPQLLRCDLSGKNRWLKVKCVGTKSNRSAIGARVTCITPDGLRRVQEVRSGGGYLSQSDLRLHFGLGTNETANLEIRWPNGGQQSMKDVASNQIVRVVEKLVRQFFTGNRSIVSECFGNVYRI